MATDRDTADEARPQSVEEALGLALRHSRNALAEAILAGRALLDAASLGLTGRPVTSTGAQAAQSEPVRALARAIEGLETLAARLRADDPEATRRLVDALLAALDTEIVRWEGRAHSDPDARAVLRAFLGLRELLWELGLRPRPAGAEAPTETRKKAGKKAETAEPDAKSEESEPAGTSRRRARRPRSEPARAQSAASPPRRRQRVQRVDVES